MWDGTCMVHNRDCLFNPSMISSIHVKHKTNLNNRLIFIRSVVAHVLIRLAIEHIASFRYLRINLQVKKAKNLTRRKNPKRQDASNDNLYVKVFKHDIHWEQEIIRNEDSIWFFCVNNFEPILERLFSFYQQYEPLRIQFSLPSHSRTSGS